MPLATTINAKPLPKTVLKQAHFLFFLSHKQQNHRNINDLFTVKDSMHFLFRLLDLFDPTKFVIFVFLRDVIDSQEEVKYEQ